jgi:hypothetical protein
MIVASSKGDSMTPRIVALLVVGLLAVGVGVAFAATQAGVTSVCANDVNGLLRAADTCRDGEHRLAIGGGGNAAVTQNGPFSIAPAESGGGKTLPLTGVTVSGRCETFTGPFGGDGASARVLVEAPAGKTMDFFPAEFNASPSVSSRLLPPAASVVPNMGSTGVMVSAILTANGATATLTISGYVAPDTRTCTLLWQAVEVPNQAS